MVTVADFNDPAHANSATVEVLVEDAGPVTVSNDGPAAQDNGPGLGPQMFDDMTLEWDLRREVDRTILTAVVPVA